MARLSAPALLLTASSCALVVTGVTATRANAQSPAARSTRDGVYTAAQAKRGEAVFAETCISCHGGKMWGTGWEEQTVADVFEFISQFMPESAPGSLGADQVRDTIAYILSTNGLPAGTSELPSTPDGLKAIRVERAVK